MTNREALRSYVMKIAIAGGGISGLATAFYLRQAMPDAQVIVYEKEQRLGGKMLTRNVDGFLVEEGTNGFLSNKPFTLDLVKACGCDDILIRSSDRARIRFIYKDALHRLPESPMAFARTPLLSLVGKLRVAMEFFVPPKKDDSDETLQSFGYRRVGREMTDTFLDAMVAGVFASAPDKISVNSAFPAVVKLEKEYGGLFKGMIAKKKKEAGPGGVLMSFKGGVSTFIERLAQASGARIERGVPMQGIAPCGEGFRVFSSLGEECFDKVVLSTPAYDAARLLRPIDETVAEMLEDIEYSPISVVGLGYENLDADLQGFGLLTTTSAHKKILGVLWDSSIFSDRAPEGKKLLRVMIGGQRNPDLAVRTEGELVDMAVSGVQETMGITVSPDVTFVRRYVRGIPNYRPGHGERMQQLFEKISGYKNLYLNANAYFGVALNDCVANAERCARGILA